MGSNLTAFVIASGGVMWETIESCRTVTDDVVVCDIGTDRESIRMIEDFSALKGGVSIASYSSVNEVCMNLSEERWSLILFGDELLHEDSCHFVWDLADRHPEIDAATLPVLTFDLAGWNVCGLRDDIRMFSRLVSKTVSYDGEVFSALYPRRVVTPGTLPPKPIWKFVFGGSEYKKERDEAIYAIMPKATRRLSSRSFYSTPYITR